MKLPSGKLVYPTTQITQNFTWGEATKGCTRIPQDLKIEENIINAAINLEKMRLVLGDIPIHVHSWYRPPELKIGVPNSTHQRGYAIDFHCQLSSAEVYRLLDNCHPGGLGLYPNWIHIDWRNWEGKKKARWKE